MHAAMMGRPYQLPSPLLLSAHAVYTCLTALVDTMQGEQASTTGQGRSATADANGVWCEEDVSAFVDALYGIRSRAPNGGFTKAHLNEALKIMKQGRPNTTKTVDQLAYKMREVCLYILHAVHHMLTHIVAQGHIHLYR